MTRSREREREGGRERESGRESEYATVVEEGKKVQCTTMTPTKT